MDRIRKPFANVAKVESAFTVQHAVQLSDFKGKGVTCYNQEIPLAFEVWNKAQKAYVPPFVAELF